MKPAFVQDTDDPTWWTDEEFVVAPARSAISLTAVTDEEAPDDEYVDSILRILGRIDQVVLAASELILDNYSYDHFKALGIDDDLLLKDETAAGMSQVVILTSAVFEDPDGSVFELSFEVPWDDEHSFDVTFEDGRPVCCAVNG